VFVPNWSVFFEYNFLGFQRVPFHTAASRPAGATGLRTRNLTEIVDKLGLRMRPRHTALGVEQQVRLREATRTLPAVLTFAETMSSPPRPIFSLFWWAWTTDSVGLARARHLITKLPASTKTDKAPSIVARGLHFRMKNTIGGRNERVLLRPDRRSKLFASRSCLLRFEHHARQIIAAAWP
jgi:hypothetical protein